jgi:hypothetical protein
MSFRRFPSVVLTACAVGLILCPWVFVASGALSDFSRVASLVLLPPLLLSCGFLLRRYLARPGASAARPALLGALEGIAWLVVVAFLYWISQAYLSVGFERFGAVCTAWLATSVIALPLLLLRSTRLEAQLARLPRALSIVALLLILGVATLATIVYLTTPPQFILASLAGSAALDLGA